MITKIEVNRHRGTLRRTPRGSLFPQAGTRRKITRALAVSAAVLLASRPVKTLAAGTASDGPGGGASWTTGNKLGVGTSATGTSKVWFTIAKGISTEIFYPRLDVPNMQDMQYVVTDGSTFVDLERDATDHVVSMPDEKSLEYTVTNTDRRPNPKYRITNTYITDPSRNTLMIRTSFQSLDGGVYRLYLLENPSMAGGGANDNAWWDATNSALMSSGTETLFGSPMTVVSALKVARPNGFVAHSNGYTGKPSDCYVDLSADFALNNQFDNLASNGNVVQCGQVGGIGTGKTTFTVALGYGSDSASALAAVNSSLATGFAKVESSYRTGWHTYMNTSPIRHAPASVAGASQRRRAYYVALMALHAAEDKTFQGANVAGFATPWGDFQDGDGLNDGYHRVWGRDLYHQATGLISAGDSAHALRMAKFMWNNQYISSSTQGDKTIYPTGSFPRYSPVSGIGGATPNQLGCCEQLDQDGYAILLAWMTGLTDPTTYGKIKMVANHIQTSGPDTSERWEEQSGKSPSSLSAMLGGLQAAADIARQNGDTASAKSWEGTADSWLASLPGWTFTTTGYWGGNSGHGAYYERIDKSSNPNDDATLHFDEGDFREHDVVDFGFLDLVRLGLSLPGDKKVSDSLAPSAQASDKNSTVQVTIQNGSNGDVYFRRYNHDNYGENNTDCKGWPAGGANRFGRLWPVLSGERGEYEIANGRLASVYLQSMADATNDGYFVPEQIWDRQDVSCFNFGRPTGSAAPLNWAEGQYLRLAQSMDATYNLETPTVVKAKYRGAGSIHGKGAKCVSDAGGSTTNGSHIQLSTCSGSDAQSWTWNSETGTLQVLGKCMDITGGGIANGTKIQLWDCNGTGSQEWRWRKQTSLVNPQSGRCLDTGNGNQLQISECKETPSQVWYP